MLNTIVLQGRVGKEPELRRTQTGKAVVSVNIAVTQDREPYNADWVAITMWEKTAEYFARTFRKGDVCIVNGRLGFSEWTDKNGSKHKDPEVTVYSVYAAGKTEKKEAKEPSGFIEIDDIDDGVLPF